jgi:regulator of cell morphogenesis and NO signaling
MQEFTKNNKMVDLIHSNYHLLPVIHRFGIRLGFGNKTVEMLCEDYKINTDFFLSIVNTFQNKNFFPKEKLLSFSPLLIIDYLKKTHQYYIAYSLQRIEKLLKELQLSAAQQNNEMKTIKEFYLEYKTKLLQHIEDEERKVFPYIVKLVNSPAEIENKNFKVNFEEEHENVDLEIDDLKNLIIKYISPNYNELICNELLNEIFRFEKDILNHARIEDAILIPQVRQLQKNI